MDTQLQYLDVLLKSKNNYADIFKAIENLQSLDKFLLEHFDPRLVKLYSRLETIQNISDIYELIPEGHKFIDPLPIQQKEAILKIVNNYTPTIGIKPEIRKPDLNVLQRVSDLRIDFNTVNKCNVNSNFSAKTSDGFPIVYNSRKFMLANFFQIEYDKTFVMISPSMVNSKYGILLLHIFANTLIANGIDIYGEEIGINKEIRGVIEGLATENEEKFITNLKGLIKSKTIRSNDTLYEFLTYILDECVQAKDIDEYLLNGEYNELRPLVDGSCCRVRATFFNEGCRDRAIAFDFIDSELIPQLRTLQPFKITGEHLHNVHLFLDAFPYVKNHYVCIEYVNGEAFTKFTNKGLQQYNKAKTTDATTDKFVGLLDILNFEMPYQVIYDLTRTVKFTANECMSLFTYVLDFKNYVCAFLASLICHHNLNIFDMINTKLQYQLIKCLPDKYHERYETQICKYNPTDSVMIGLKTIYSTFKPNFSLINFDKFANVIEELKLVPRNKSELYMVCSQVPFNEYYAYEYLNKIPDIDNLTTLILTRLLLGNSQLSDSEKNLLHYISNNTYVLLGNGDRKIVKFPEMDVLPGREITRYDTLTLEQYFEDDRNRDDIPLLAEDVPIQVLSKFIQISTM